METLESSQCNILWMTETVGKGLGVLTTEDFFLFCIRGINSTAGNIDFILNWAVYGRKTYRFWALVLQTEKKRGKRAAVFPSAQKVEKLQQPENTAPHQTKNSPGG